MQLTKGSVWRKWDLHLHTPSSFDYKDKSITDKQIIDGLVKAEIRLAAITDHHLIDVERIQRLQKLAKDKVTILPGIELRSELGGSDTVHYIGIFPENCDLPHIWGKLQNELNLTEREIEEAGGDDRIWVPIFKAAKSIHRYGGIVTLHAGKKSNSIEEVSNKSLFQQALKKDLLKNTVDILEIGQVSDVNDYEQIVFPAIKDYLPLIICSDNHCMTNYSHKACCWFRADPNFWGLKQAIVEPVDRIHIGDKPPKRLTVAHSRTRYIQSISVKKVVESDLEEIWFDDVNLDLNHDLVAIIGNKGTGKSALAEVIGLLGNTHSRESFSFLAPERFRQPMNNLAIKFEGSLTWANDSTQVKNLNDEINLNAPEQVKCIPQGLFEEICNEVSSGKDSKFNRELRKVIFSHVPEPDRLGKSSLDNLLTHLTDEINGGIEILKNRLKEKNHEIANIEDRLTAGHQQKLENQLKEKQAELAAHDKNKPENVTLPSAPIDKHLTENLNNLNNQFETTENEIIQANSEVSTNAIKINSAEKILDKLSNFEIQFEQFKKHISSDLSTFEIPFDSIVKLDIQKKPLREKVELLKAKRKEAENLIDSDEAESLTLKRTHIQNQIDNLQSELDEPSKQYEEYQTNLRSWEYQRTEIVGDVKRVGAILYFEKQIDELKKLPSLSKTVRIERLNIVEEIFLKIESLASVYRELYSPVQAFSSENRISNDGFDLKFDVSIIDQGLEQHFFDWIARNVTGSFYGSEEGLKTLKKIIDQHNFNNWIGVKSFLNELLDHLEFDKRQNAKAPMHVKTQLRKEKESSSFYDYLFSLDYLRPRYVLKLDDKELSQLSPGERGSLLLIFYLLVDKARIPLIIDQPEENLDNQTVYRHVVNAIKQAKNRRQVIIVTHNPNLAVVCDAEQIICCSIDKKNGNRMTYKSGSIENPYINQQIVDILEGTKPAFTNRRKKYAPFQEPSTILENNNNAS